MLSNESKRLTKKQGYWLKHLRRRQSRWLRAPGCGSDSPMGSCSTSDLRSTRCPDARRLSLLAPVPWRATLLRFGWAGVY